MRIDFASDTALILYFEDYQDLNRANQQVKSMVHALDDAAPDWLVDIVPSYRSLLVLFNPLKSDFVVVSFALKQIFNTSSQYSGYDENAGSAHVIQLPVLYGVGEHDLKRVAMYNGLSTNEVVQRHCKVEYQVYAIGFAPGFAYMGEVDPSIATPRLDSPRRKVPQGAVAIAEQQTAVYPATSPGGWNILGLCPVNLFNPNNTPVMPLSVGDKVRFCSIDKGHFLSLGGQLD